ncbi:hypothetical protein D2B43_18070 [Salmonella enterica]|nr:hypothetical protein [Salmonella enterica]
MEAKKGMKILIVLALAVLTCALVERVTWQTAATYPALLAGHRAVSSPARVDSFSVNDARMVCGIKDSDDVYENADVSFKKNGTFVRCKNHFIDRVYLIQYAQPIPASRE